MRSRVLLTTLAMFFVALPLQAFPWSIGVRFGAPYCYRPYYYRPYVVVPSPVYVAPAPVVLAPAPVIAASPVAEDVAEVPPPPPQAPARTTVRAARSAPVDLGNLSDPSEQVRIETITRLGRAKETRAVGALVKLLNNDPSTKVRNAAARALGQIGSQEGLTALQTAASADADRTVRNSAGVSAEIIRASLRR